MPISLTPPALSDIEKLLAFELTNRRFFEANINARAPSYYSTEGVTEAIRTATQRGQGKGPTNLLWPLQAR